MYGYTEASSSQIGWAAPTYVAATDEQAVDEARPHIEAFFNDYLNMPFEFLFPPGYLSMGSLKGMLAHKQSIKAGTGQTIEGLIEAGIFLCGSPETVKRKLTEAHRLTGFQNFVGMMQFGTLSKDNTMKNLDMFAEHVMPHLRALDDDGFVGLEAAAE